MLSRVRFALLAALSLTSLSLAAQTQKSAASPAPAGVITAADAAKILPPAVFFRGLSAPVQARNSGGVRFADMHLMLVTLVDTSGYSSQVQEKYQAYLITEDTIEIEGHRLVPGAYGCGFIANNTFIVQDLGAHDLFTAHSTRDTDLHRPTPLQVITDTTAGTYRLYAGRSYISFHPVSGQ